MESKEVIYNNFISKDYCRVYSTGSYLSQTPVGDFGIDFYEEFVESVRMLDQEDQEDQDEEYATIFVNREKKVSIVMSESEAVYLAQKILEKFEGKEIYVEEDV